MCISSLLYVSTSREHSLAMWRRERSLSHNLQASQVLGFPQSCFASKTLATPCRAKISKSQIQKGNRYWHLSLCSCLYQELRDTSFSETSLLFVGVLGLRAPFSTAEACSAQWGMKTGSPEDMICNWRTCYSFFLPCADITFVPILNPAKSSPPCKSEAEDIICFAANIMFMAKLQGVM